MAMPVNWSQSVDEFAATVGSIHDMYHKILSYDLNMSRVTQRSVPRILTQDQRDVHTVCGDLLSSADDDGTFLNRIIIRDETWCFLYDLRLKRQSATWKSPLSLRRGKPRQDRSKGKEMLELFFDSSGRSKGKEMLELFSDSSGIFQLEFIPQGGTVNNHTYKDILRR